MSVKVKCNECGKVLAAPDAARGKAVKCPQCQARVAVPAEEAPAKTVSKSASAKASKAKAKKSGGFDDSEASLMNFDMSRASDNEARICPKCGFDMKYQDEEDTECSQCGFDTAVGGLGSRARKKAMKGPDPADFYPGLMKDAFKFLGRNNFLAIRTIVYTGVCLSLSSLFAFLFLWISMWPTRVFIGLCFLISFLVIPGWMWVLDTEVIKLTLERKDKFKKLNFDFFLSSAMGLAFVIWSVVVGVPLGFLSILIGYLAVKYGNSPPYVQTTFNIIALIPGIFVLPAIMAHMSMPVQFKAWQFWQVARIAVNNIKPLLFSLLWFVITNIVGIAGVAVIGALYGSDIVSLVGVMEKNAEIRRAKFALEENPNAKTKKKGDANAGKSDAEKQREIWEKVSKQELGNPNFKIFIVPGIILFVMVVVNGFTSMINMRIHGQFTYYNKGTLELVDRLKEYKYVAKEKVDELEEATKPKTIQQLIVDAFAFVMIFDLLGGIAGMLYGNMSADVGTMRGIFFGLLMGHGLAIFTSFLMNVVLAFKVSAVWGLISFFCAYPIGFIVFVFQNFEERKGPFIQVIFVYVIWATLFITGVTTGFFAESNSKAQQQAAPPATNPAAMPGMNPGMMPSNPGMMPGQPTPPAGTPPQ